MGGTAVLVDQHPLFLEVVEQHVTKLGFEIVGTFTTAVAASASLESLSPDLLVTGIEMPADQMDGIELVAEARLRVPDLRAIVLSVQDDKNLVDAAFDAGAQAYVLKTADPVDLTSAIRQAFLHSIYLSHDRSRSGRARPAGEAAAYRGLTRRELEILQLVAEGHSNAELARMLWVTEQTVKFHLSNVYRKLNVSNRTEASRWAQLNGVLPVRLSEAERLEQDGGEPLGSAQRRSSRPAAHAHRLTAARRGQDPSLTVSGTGSRPRLPDPPS
jgi:DNA-binding NarL/FixJ family response regulator